jgi:hypothetical protein
MLAVKIIGDPEPRLREEQGYLWLSLCPPIAYPV